MERRAVFSCSSVGEIPAASYMASAGSPGARYVSRNVRKLMMISTTIICSIRFRIVFVSMSASVFRPGRRRQRPEQWMKNKTAATQMRRGRFSAHKKRLPGRYAASGKRSVFSSSPDLCPCTYVRESSLPSQQNANDRFSPTRGSKTLTVAVPSMNLTWFPILLRGL